MKACLSMESLFSIPAQKIIFLVFFFIAEQIVTLKILRPRFRHAKGLRSSLKYLGQSLFMLTALVVLHHNFAQFLLVMAVYIILIIFITTRSSPKTPP